MRLLPASRVTGIHNIHELWAMWQLAEPHNSKAKLHHGQRAYRVSRAQVAEAKHVDQRVDVRLGREVDARPEQATMGRRCEGCNMFHVVWSNPKGLTEDETSLFKGLSQAANNQSRLPEYSSVHLTRLRVKAEVPGICSCVGRVYVAVCNTGATRKY